MNAASIISLIAVIVTALATALSGTVQTFWGEHPEVATTIIAIWTAVAHFLPAPKATAKE